MQKTTIADRKWIIHFLIWITLVALIGDLLSNQSMNAAVFNRYSVSKFIMLVATSTAALFLSIRLVWQKINPEGFQSSVGHWGEKYLQNRWLAAVGLLGGILGVSMLWWLDLPIWYSAAHKITLLIFLIGCDLILRSDLPIDRYVNQLIQHHTLTAVILYVLCLLALSVGVYFVNTKADEGSIVYAQVQFSYGLLKPYAPGSLQSLYAPFTYFLHGPFQVLFGPSLTVSRWVSALLGMVAVGLLYQVATREGGIGAGLLALGIILLSPSTLRSYSTSYGYSAGAAFLMGALWATGTVKRPWLKVASVLIFSGCAVFVRHTLFLAPIIFVVYFLFTERIQAWLPGALAALVFAMLVIIPLWPDIIWMTRIVPGATKFLPGFSVEIFYKNRGSPPLHISQLVSSLDVIANYQTLFILSALVVILTWRYISTSKRWREQLRSQRILLLAVVLFTALYVSNWLISAFLPRCFNCMIYYSDYMVPVWVLIVAILTIKLWPTDSDRPKTAVWATWGAALLALMVIGPQARNAWQYKLPSPNTEVANISQELSQYIKPGDHVFYLGMFHPMIQLPDRYIYPELDFALYNYVGPTFDLTREELANHHYFNDELVEEWLSQDADVVVTTDFYLKKMVGFPSFTALLEELTDEYYEPVMTIKPASDSFQSGEIHIYQRKHTQEPDSPQG